MPITRRLRGGFIVAPMQRVHGGAVHASSVKTASAKTYTATFAGTETYSGDTASSDIE
jgi:hypothetical protein